MTATGMIEAGIVREMAGIATIEAVSAKGMTGTGMIGAVPKKSALIGIGETATKPVTTRTVARRRKWATTVAGMMIEEIGRFPEAMLSVLRRMVVGKETSPPEKPSA